VMRTMVTRWSDEDIAASLNPMGVPTGQGKSWTAHRVSSVRRVNGIHTYRSPRRTANGSRRLRQPRRSELRTTASAGSARPASSPASRLCRALPTKSVPTTCNRNGWLPRLGEQVVRVASCRQTNFQCFQTIEEEGHNECRIANGRSGLS
jgi:hypothetical protein